MGMPPRRGLELRAVLPGITGLFSPDCGNSKFCSGARIGDPAIVSGKGRKGEEHETKLPSFLQGTHTRCALPVAALNMHSEISVGLGINSGSQFPKLLWICKAKLVFTFGREKAVLKKHTRRHAYLHSPCASHPQGVALIMLIKDGEVGKARAFFINSWKESMISPLPGGCFNSHQGRHFLVRVFKKAFKVTACLKRPKKAAY